MPDIPRRLPPTPEERLNVVVSRMAGGSSAGATRWAQPVTASTYRATEASASATASTGVGDGTTVGRYLDGFTIGLLDVAQGEKWLFTGFLSANLPAYFAGDIWINMGDASGNLSCQLTGDGATIYSIQNLESRSACLIFGSGFGSVIYSITDSATGIGDFANIAFTGSVETGDAGGDGLGGQFAITVSSPEWTAGDGATYLTGGVVFTRLTEGVPPGGELGNETSLTTSSEVYEVFVMSDGSRAFAGGFVASYSELGSPYHIEHAFLVGETLSFVGSEYYANSYTEGQTELPIAKSVALGGTLGPTPTLVRFPDENVPPDPEGVLVRVVFEETPYEDGEGHAYRLVTRDVERVSGDVIIAS